MPKKILGDIEGNDNSLWDKMKRQFKNKTVNHSIKNVNLLEKRAYKQAQLLDLLSQYIPYKKIQKKLNLKKNAISMSFKRFKEYGLINEDRTLTSKGQTLIKNVNLYSTPKTVNSTTVNFPSDSIRSHNLVFTLSVPIIQNWDRRRSYLNVKNIKFKKLNQFNGEAVIIDNRKIWLTQKSIIIYMGESYFANTSDEAIGNAINDLFKTVNLLEKQLKVSLKYPNGYKLRVSRQHHALIKNALAKQYDHERKKLYVRDDTGIWLIIDNSLQLHETEAIRAKTSLDDIRSVQDLFNSVKEKPFTSYDISSLTDRIKDISILTKETASLTSTNQASILTMIRNIQETQKIIIGELNKK